MKITNNQAFIANNYLSELNLAKFEKDLRISIFKNVGELDIVVKNVQDKLEVTKQRLFKDLKDEASKVSALRLELEDKSTSIERRYNIVEELNQEQYKSYFQAEREYFELTNKFGEDEIDVNLETIDFDKFIDGVVDSETKVTANLLQKISFLFKN